MNTPILDYSKIFNRLCHMVVLTRENRTEQCIDNIVISLFVTDSSFKPSSVNEIAEALGVYFGLPLGDSAIQLSLDRQLSRKALTRDSASGLYSIQLEAKSELEARIEQAYELESRVREQWLQSIEKSMPNYSKDMGDQLWECLRSYMGKAFERHGVETTRLLYDVDVIEDDGSRSLSTYLNESIEECCPDIEPQIVVEYIRAFFQNSTSERTKYLAQLLDGTFTFYALANDKSTTDYLNKAISPLSLFLDTNFIFGILDLHLNPLDDIAKEVIKIIQSNNMPFKIYYHEETLSEIQYVVGSAAKTLRRHTDWQQPLSRAIVRSGRAHGIELRYHQKNSEAPLSPDIFLSKYEAMPELLQAEGFDIYRSSTRKSEEEAAEEERLIAEYDRFIVEQRPERGTHYELLKHDIVIWKTAKSLRRRGISALDTRALILSLDHCLYDFAWTVLRGGNPFALVVMPNQFLQLLRPFIPPSDDLDRHFVETFAVPEFRVATSDYTETSSKIISFLNTYRDVNEETALRILASSVLTEQLSKVDEEDPQFRNAIDSFLIEYNTALLENNKLLLAKKEAAEQNAKKQAKNVEDLQEKLESVQNERSSVDEHLERLEAKAKKAEEDLARQNNAKRIELDKLVREKREIAKEKNEYKTLALRIRVALVILVWFIGIAAIVLLPSQISWSWLASHPKRLGLYLCSAVIWSGMSLTFISWKRLWKLSFTSVIVGGLYVLVQILDKSPSGTP